MATMRSLICVGVITPWIVALPAFAQLNYVDRSTGLQTPQMEGGYGGVALGDVNNDGLIDVGYGMHHNYSGVDFGDQILEVALGDGTGHNWTPWDDGLATNGETWGMFGTDFADVDNDGDLDVGSISFGCCAGVHVYLNNGDGTWTQSFGFVGGNSNALFEFGDVDGDGHADFAAAHQYGTVYLGDGAGGFALADGNLPPPGSGGRPGVALGDINDDGRDDLAFATSTGGLNVWTWISPGQWQNLSGTLPASGGFRLAQIADMDLDGHGDVVAFDPGEPGLIAVFGGDGAGNWQQIASVTTPDGCDHAAFRAGVDADHNGYLDIAYVAEENCSPWTGGTNRPRFFAESSTPESAWIHPQYPRGGETFVAGSVRFVEWSAAVPDPSQSSMTIERSSSGPDGPWHPVAEGVPDNGRYQWLIPATLPTSDNCYLRYTLNTAGGDAVAVTPAAFTILGAGIPGDLDGDGDVDLTDLAALLAAYGACEGDPDYNPAADLDGSGCVDLTDLATLLSHYGEGP
jgi:hypothetical protein